MDLTLNLPFPQPKLEIILAACRGSKEPIFETDRFKRYLLEYKKNGIFCRTPMLITPEKRMWYRKKQEKYMDSYIERQKGLLRLMVLGERED